MTKEGKHKAEQTIYVNDDHIVRVTVVSKCGKRCRVRVKSSVPTEIVIDTTPVDGTIRADLPLPERV